MRLRVGLIGLGKHGLRYAKHIREDVPELELAAVCRRDAARGEQDAKRLACEYVPDPRELAEREDIDVVVFASAPAVIEESAAVAAARGKRLLVEKPVAVDLASGLRVLAALDRANAYCLAGQTLRLNAVVASMAEALPALGRLDTLIFSQRFPPQLALAWLDEPELSGGGNVMHTGVHCFDLARLLTGAEPLRAFCESRAVYTKRTEDVFAATLFMADQTLVTVNCSRTTQSRNGLIEASGENGQLVGDHVLHTLYRIGPHGREDLPLPAPRHTVLELLRVLVEDCRHERPASIDYRAGLAAVAIADACYRSVKSRRPEDVVMPPERP